MLRHMTPRNIFTRFGLVIILLLLNSSDGVVNPGCECITFQGQRDRLSGTFTSPNYPRPYRREYSVPLYIFVAPPNSNKVVEVIFTDLDLGDASSSNNCNAGDKLSLYLNQPEPSITENIRQDAEICGNLSVLRTNSFFSSQGVLIMELSTIEGDRQQQQRGFKGKFNFLDAEQFQSDGIKRTESSCSYYIMSWVKPEGKFFSPSYPQDYKSNTSCEWVFDGEWNERVQITFLKIDLARRSQSNRQFNRWINLKSEENQPNGACDIKNKNNDFIAVYDGDNSNAPLIGAYCGLHEQQEIISTGKRMYIKFVTSKEINMQGFAALFRFTKPKQDTLAYTCDRTINSEHLKSGYITSENYPNQYEAGSVCTYTFQGTDRERVRIEFNDFDLGEGSSDQNDCNLQDKLTVSFKVNTYLKTLNVLCGSQKPLSIMSNGAYLQLRFEALSEDPQARGFNLSFKFLKDFGIKSDNQVDFIPCMNKYVRSEKKTGEITSPNYPGLYPQDTVCSYLFDGQGEKVMINFTHFDVKGEPPGCLDERNSDYVSFSNYYVAKDEKMSRYCINDDLGFQSDILKKAIVSDGDFFRVTFKSGMAHLGTGFRAVYSFVDQDNTDKALEFKDTKNKGICLKETVINYVLILVTICYITRHWLE